MYEPTNLEEQVSDRYLTAMLAHFLAPFWFRITVVFVALLAATGLTLALPYIVQKAVDGPITAGDVNGVVPYGAAYLVVIGLLTIARLVQTYVLQDVGQDALVNIRQTLFAHIMRQDMRFFNNTPVGQIVSRLGNDIDALTDLLSTSIVMVASNMITLLGIIVVMLVINWRLALISLAVMPVMTVATIFFRTRIRRASNEFHKVIAEYLAFINEQFNGMLIIQLFGRQEISREGMHTVNKKYRDVHNVMRDYYTYYAAIIQVLTAVGLALVLYGGGNGVLAGWATLGMLLSFIDYTRRSFDPIAQLADQFSQIQTAFAAGERIARMLKVEPQIVEPEKPVHVEWAERSFKFDHVFFHYEEGHPVLRDVNFSVASGQRVAIVGATGAGKTSTVGLLARFYDVNEGHVLINGVDVRELSFADLRRFVTVVPQNPYCFNGTIADNLRLFNPNITYEQMKTAAHTACADKFIDKLPGSYDFKLLPGGANLSQGQRQLLALARALIHNPDSILVLDEATSNIDTETEAYIQEGLQNVLQDRTCMIIAHRLSTIREVDRILVMQLGQVMEEGTHTQLLKRNGLYAQLYRRQFEENEPVKSAANF
ncbi:MAG TPA: ABC transporter ATP-binding protein [Phototrophicaceae bacterium]|nr:ABC transporter ATP-binding protein [Phototrophicaceae bacterium]